MQHLRIPRRFNGPPRSANGGWTAGALAESLPERGLGVPVTVALRQPPPLDTPLPLTPSHTGVVASHLGRPVAEAKYAETDPPPTARVPTLVAAAAEARYAGLRHHPFPTCFACGTARRPGDGLRIFPGQVDPADLIDPPATAERVVAATWSPFESTVPITWAALDCSGGWASHIAERPMVLGTMTARIHRLPTTAERYVVVGELHGSNGRKTLTGSTLYDSVGDIVATAQHIWIAIDPQEFS